MLVERLLCRLNASSTGYSDALHDRTSQGGGYPSCQTLGQLYVVRASEFIYSASSILQYAATFP